MIRTGDINEEEDIRKSSLFWGYTSDSAEYEEGVFIISGDSIDEIKTYATEWNKSHGREPYHWVYDILTYKSGDIVVCGYLD